MFINPTTVRVVWPVQETEKVWICGLQQLELGLEPRELSHLMRSESAHLPFELLYDQTGVNIDCSTHMTADVRTCQESLTTAASTFLRMLACLLTRMRSDIVQAWSRAA